MKKRRNKKALTFGLVGAVAVAGAGIAYATWVITQTSDTYTGNVTVSADNVVDNTILITNPQVVATANTISFGAPSTYNSNSLISNTSIAGGTTAVESLSFMITFDLEWASDVSGSVSATMGVYSSEANASNVALGSSNITTTVFDANYVVTPVTSATKIVTITTGAASLNSGISGISAYQYTSNISSTTVSVTPSLEGSRNKASFLAVYTFSWGSAFNSTNPIMANSVDGSFISALNAVYGYNNWAINVHLTSSISN